MANINRVCFDSKSPVLRSERKGIFNYQPKSTINPLRTLTVNVFFFLLGGGAPSCGVAWYLSSNVLTNGELVLFAFSSSESISSCRRRRAVFASTLGDSHFDNEFGSIFDTPNFIFPMNDCQMEERNVIKQHIL